MDEAFEVPADFPYNVEQMNRVLADIKYEKLLEYEQAKHITHVCIDGIITLPNGEKVDMKECSEVNSLKFLHTFFKKCLACPVPIPAKCFQYC